MLQHCFVLLAGWLGMLRLQGLGFRGLVFRVFESLAVWAAIRRIPFLEDA